MKTNIYFIIYCCCAFLASQIAIAQCNLLPLSLQERTANASYIFEGIVVGQLQTVWDRTHQHIYTIQTVQLTKLFEGELGTTVLIATQGGTVEDITEIVTPSLSLQQGDIGLFFANQANIPIDVRHPIILLTPYADTQGFIEYDLANNTAHDPTITYKNIEKEIYLPIIAQQQENYQTIAPLPYPTMEKQEQLLPAITDFFPSIVRAGQNDSITINGTGFGTYTGEAAVLFRNPNYYGITIAYQPIPANHIVSWSDTQIRVIVPGRDIVLNSAGAGSGHIRVKDSSGQVAESDNDITVLHNKTVAGFSAVNLSNDNAMGGYTVQYNNDFFANTSAKNAFNRALQTWRCAALVNVNIGTSNTTVSCPANDNINLISFDTNCTLPVGTLGQTTQWYASCTNGDKFFIEMDMIFSTAVTWNYNSSPTASGQKDFESIAVHELGHTHGQGHVLDYGKLMYPSLASGTDIRTIDNDALACAHTVVVQSTEENGCTGGAYIPDATACGVRLRAKLLLQGAYNTNTGLMNMGLTGVIPLSQPFNRVPWLYEGTENITSMLMNIVDWVLVEVQSPTNGIVLERRAALLRNDGMLLNIDGSIGVPFSNIIPYNNYHILVRHRNHLAVTSSNSLILPNVMPLDFSNAQNVLLGTQQMALMSDGQYALFAGDCFANGVISVTDFNIYISQVGSPSNQYLDGDCNMDKNITADDLLLYESNATVIGISEVR